jgi:hypothetical protein
MAYEEELIELKAKLTSINSRIEKLEREQNGGYTSQMTKSFHLGMAGGSGRNVRSLNMKRERELDKTIRIANILVPLYRQKSGIEKHIEDIESGKRDKKEANAADIRIKKAEFWRNLKPGDELPIGNPNGNPIIKTKNRLSAITTGGTKWTASEVIGREAAKLI